MSNLQNPRHEAFAQARAKGAFLDDAYEDAGFAPARGHGSRLAGQPEVAARIAELRSMLKNAEGASHATVIAALLSVAADAQALETSAGAKEARLALLDACRLNRELARERSLERLTLR